MAGKIFFLFSLFVWGALTSRAELNNLLAPAAPGYNEVAEFIKNNTEPSEFYIANNNTNFLSIEAERPGLGRYTFLEDKGFKESILRNGFGTTMESYNIRYLVTSATEPEYDKFVNLFSSESEIPVELEDVRGERILQKLGNPPNSVIELNLRTKEAVEKYKIKDKFQLVEQFGIFRVFKFVN